MKDYDFQCWFLRFSFARQDVEEEMKGLASRAQSFIRNSDPPQLFEAYC
jgi:hypothetical protein